jgi:hypothetical protein
LYPKRGHLKRSPKVGKLVTNSDRVEMDEEEEEERGEEREEEGV